MLVIVDERPVIQANPGAWQRARMTAGRLAEMIAQIAKQATGKGQLVMPGGAIGRQLAQQLPGALKEVGRCFFCVRADLLQRPGTGDIEDRKSTRLNSSHVRTSYAVFCLK